MRRARGHLEALARPDQPVGVSLDRKLGRALLAACEAAVAERGISRLELNVHGHNATAIRLYDTSGYGVVTQQLRKTVR